MATDNDCPILCRNVVLCERATSEEVELIWKRSLCGSSLPVEMFSTASIFRRLFVGLVWANTRPRQSPQLKLVY